jgi:hypothetical protein
MPVEAIGRRAGPGRLRRRLAGTKGARLADFPADPRPTPANCRAMPLERLVQCVLPEIVMAVSLVARRRGAVQPRLQFPSVLIAARMVLRLAETGLPIPAIVDDHNVLIWEYPGGDPNEQPARTALSALRLLAGSPS